MFPAICLTVLAVSCTLSFWLLIWLWTFSMFVVISWMEDTVFSVLLSMALPAASSSALEDFISFIICWSLPVKLLNPLTTRPISFPESMAMRFVKSAFPEAISDIAPSTFKSGLSESLRSRPAIKSMSTTESMQPIAILLESWFVTVRISFSSMEMAKPQFVPFIPRYATSLLEPFSFTHA